MSLRDAPAHENPQFTQQSPMAAAAATPADEKGSFSYQIVMSLRDAPAHENP